MSTWINQEYQGAFDLGTSNTTGLNVNVYYNETKGINDVRATTLPAAWGGVGGSEYSAACVRRNARPLAGD